MKYLDDTIYFDDGSRIYCPDLKFFEKTMKRSYTLPILRMIKIQNILNSMNEKDQ